MIDQKLKSQGLPESSSFLKLLLKSFLAGLLPIFLIVENAFGPWARNPYTFLIEKFLVGGYLLILLGIIFFKGKAFSFLERMMRGLVRGFSEIFAFLILSILFIFNLPGGYFQRRKVLVDRPALKAWVYPKIPLSDNTWVKAKLHLKLEDESKRGMLRLLNFFYRNSSRYLFVLLTFLILLSLVLLFINSSYVAPFVYTLF